MTDNITADPGETDIDETPDHDLIRRARAGDRDALAHWLRLALPAAAGLVATRLPRHRRGDELDDIVQETALRAVGSIDRLRHAGQARSWLCGIALNVLEEHRRREARRRNVMQTDTDHIERTEAPAAVAEGTHTIDALQAAIDELPEAHREVLMMKYAAGLRYRDIAEALGIAPDTVKARLTEARRRLRTRLEENDE